MSGATLSVPQEYDPLSNQRVSLLYYFEIFIFDAESINFSKSAYKLILRGERAPKNFVKIFQKLPKNSFMGLFLFQKVWTKRGLYSDLRKLKKSIWSP